MSTHKVARCSVIRFRSAGVAGLMLAAAVLPLSGQVLGVWPYRQMITVASTLADGNLTNFPLLVSITNAANPLFQRAQAAGQDIVFTAADGNTRLDHEIEHFSATPGSCALHAWVRLPLLRAGVQTNLYLHYGRPDVGDQSAATNVWDADHVAVWHLDEEAAGTNTVGLYRDSTGHGRHGNDKVTTVDKTGRVGRGQRFVATAKDCIHTVTPGYLNWSNNFTVSAWIRTNTNDYWMSAVGTSGGDYPYLIARHNNNLGVWGYQLTNAVAAYSAITYAFSPSPADWTYMTVRREADTVTIYQNGVLSKTDTNLAQAKVYSDISLTLGAHGTAASGNRYWEGWVDEVRASSTARSLNWIRASYRIMKDNGAYLIIGPERPMKIDGLWPFRQSVTISGSLAGTNLNNFPVLVAITNAANPIFALARSDGADILFTSQDDLTEKLPHEIEYFSAVPGSEALYAWVRVPELKPGIDTTLFLYYGKPDSEPQAAPKAVWDDDFLSVYHMREGTGTASADATMRGNHAQLKNYNVTGTATSGGLGNLTDTGALKQLDKAWTGRTLQIVTTTDGLAPQGETRMVTNFNRTATTLYFNEFSAPVEVGDTYKLYYETPGVGPTWISAGAAGPALQFDGYEDYLTVTNASMPLDTQLTQEIWLRLAPKGVDLTKEYTLMDDQDRFVSTCLKIGSPGVNDGSLDYFVVTQNLYNATGVTAVEAYNARTITYADSNAWVHVAGSFDGTNLHLFRNGVELARTYNTSGTPVSSLRSLLGLYIGCGWSNYSGDEMQQWFPGSLDEARISRVARSPAWMTATYRVVAQNPVYISLGKQQSRIKGTQVLLR